MTAAAPEINRAARRKARKQHDLGPSNDPIRQQGRDPEHKYDEREWFQTTQLCDRSRLACRRRMYHAASYQTTSGHTFDEHFENLSDLAREFEDAGINLGWGGCSATGGAGVRGSVEADQDRRYSEPRPNKFRRRLVEKARPASKASKGGHHSTRVVPSLPVGQEVH